VCPGDEFDERPRTRDPERKQRLLAAAADLVARRGYHAVGISDIGAAAGVTGAAVYRHFVSKAALLVALFDRVIDGLLEQAGAIVAAGGDRQDAVLALLVRGQVDFAMNERELLQVYSREIHNLPADDRRRLRRKQRHYLEEWVHLVVESRADLTDTEARTLVHAAIGAIQSSLYYESGLSTQDLRRLLTAAGLAVLGMAAVVRDDVSRED
jgi:AcrR family transcriptional regulator